jgi:histidinol-phosphatase
MLGERYLAAAGHGATRNGDAIRVSDRSSVADAMVICGDVETWLGGSVEPGLLALLGAARRQRGFGDFWGHGLVASGAADVMLEPELAIWDYAAPVCIVEEAGGKVTQLDGSALEHGGSAIATNGLIHDEVLSILRDGGAA